MSLTLPEICDKLKEYDEVTLLERLNITSEELVNRFIDVIEDKFDEFDKEFSVDD